MSWLSIGPPAVGHSPAAPRLAARIDDEGREVLDYIPGEVRHDMPRWQRDESILADVARALRAWHDATTTFEVRPDDVWFWSGREPREVICRSNFAPHNHVFRDHRFVGAIERRCPPDWRRSSTPTRATTPRFGTRRMSSWRWWPRG
jgi:hypothetical protein